MNGWWKNILAVLLAGVLALGFVCHPCTQIILDALSRFVS